MDLATPPGGDGEGGGGPTTPQGISIDGEAVVELWVDDDTQSVAVNIFDRGVGQVDGSTIYDGIDVDITLDVGGTVNVGVGADHAYADRTCDAMYVTGADGVSRAYGVIEVCEPSFGGEIVTFNRWETRRSRDSCR